MGTLKVLIALLWLALYGNSIGADAELHQVEKLRWVEKANPISDAQVAVAKKQFVLLGINGYTWTIPGVEESKKFAYREKFGVRILEGTSDVVLGENHMRLIGMAKSYAETYNRYVLSHAP